MSVMDVVASMLGVADIENVFTTAPARRTCATPIVVQAAEFEQIAEGKHAGRWTALVPVLVVAESAMEGYHRARLCSRALNEQDWHGLDAEDADVLGVVAGMPSYRGTDSGGYFIWRVDARLTCETV